jgi:hypothetical protein
MLPPQLGVFLSLHWIRDIEMNVENNESKRPRFDGTVNLGHIITMTMIMAGGFGMWTTLDKRVVVLEENRRTQQAVDGAQDARYDYGLRQVQNHLDRMDSKLDRLIEKRP